LHYRLKLTAACCV